MHDVTRVKENYFPLILFGLILSKGLSIIPDGQLVVSNGGGDCYCAPASFGRELPSRSKAPLDYLFLPSSNSQGCDAIQGINPLSEFILLMERGNCTFTDKAMNAQKAGASGVIIYNSLKGLYRGIAYGIDKTDYECGNGEAWVSDVQQPYWSSENQPDECTQNPKCSSRKCILTNVTDPELGTKACCAWDLYISIGGDATVGEQIDVPVAFITMSDADVLLANTDLQKGDLKVSMFLRPWSYYNLSSFLIWSLAVFTVLIGAYQSSTDIRIKLAAMDQGISPAAVQRGAGEEEAESLHLTVWHTLGFIVMASRLLFILYYFDVGLMVTLVYAISCSGALAALVLKPLFMGLFGKHADEVLCPCPQSVGGYVSMVDAACAISGLGIAVWWFLVRDTADYAWVLQDLFGVCLCVLFLSLIRLPNIKVASYLLVLAFCYDIFFVFISPLIFEHSIMVQVATGGEATADPTFCEKYPKDSGCQTREQLPMLLLMPRINDYHGGYAMLGLGDMVLPGLLVSFSLRLDYARRHTFLGGYFILMAIGYGIGLFMADVGVYVMQMGQPALLYLVPCTLGVFCLRAYCKGQLLELWENPAFLNTPVPLGEGSSKQQIYTADIGQEKRPLLANL